MELTIKATDCPRLEKGMKVYLQNHVDLLAVFTKEENIVITVEDNYVKFETYPNYRTEITIGGYVYYQDKNTYKKVFIILETS